MASNFKTLFLPYSIITLALVFVVGIATITAQTRQLPVDTTITTKHSVTVNGQSIPYTATAGTQPVYGEDGKPIASLFYVYYKRTDVKNSENRPIFISFNGGPGAASLWMHMGYTSPVRLKVSAEGYPVQPYGVVENHHSIIDIADIVYVNPVNVGLSRIVGDADRDQFFGVNDDIRYLADWISNFVSRHDRWRSPKYLIGESYGTTRVSGLASELQDRHWLSVNGVILVSPTELGIQRSGPVEDALPLPYYTAAAWYHNQLPAELQQKDLTEILPEVEKFTIEEYIPALSHGGFIDDARKQQIAEKVAYYSSTSVEEVLNHNLIIPKRYFWKDLLREQGFTIGRLDSRYKGVDRKDAGSNYDYAPEYASWKHSFTPAINYYLREVLGFKTDLEYMVSGSVRPWERAQNRTGYNLRTAMAKNPSLHVFIQSGYFDGATDYFSAKYTLWQIDQSGKFRDRLHYKAYKSGHMVYLIDDVLIKSNDDIRTFVKETLPPEGKPIKYDTEAQNW